MPSWRRHSRWLVVVAVVAGAVGCAALILGRQSAAGSVSPLPVPKRSLLVYSTPNSTPPGGSPPAVYRAAPNGQRAVRLTAGRDPMLSPDGRWIDFRRGDGTNDRLFVINSAGGRPRDLGTKTDDDAVWSCNSRLIVAARYERASVVDIRDGSVRTFKVPVASGGYTFAPDGRSFALSRATARGLHILTMRLADGRIRALTTDGHSGAPLWGPRGIAFERSPAPDAADGCGICRGDIWLMNSDGGDVHQVTHTHSAIFPDAWSANGDRMLGSIPPANNGKLYAVDVTSARRGR